MQEEEVSQLKHKATKLRHAVPHSRVLANPFGVYAILILHSAFLLCKGIHHREEISQLKISHASKKST